MTVTKKSVDEIFEGSNGAETRKLLRQLECRGFLGRLAAALFRAQKASTRAKMYGGGEYYERAYDQKNQQLEKICEILGESNTDIRWGWGIDKGGDPEDVLYVDLPNGQVSFHSFDRFAGPDYEGEWEGWGSSSEVNLIEFCEEVLQTIDEQEAQKKVRVQKPKQEFVCPVCGTKNESSQKRPPKWISYRWCVDEYILCSWSCVDKLEDELDAKTFGPDYKFQSGKHVGVRLDEVDDDYLEWAYGNINYEPSIILRASFVELRRRGYPGIMRIHMLPEKRSKI